MLTASCSARLGPSALFALLFCCDSLFNNAWRGVEARWKHRRFRYEVDDGLAVRGLLLPQLQSLRKRGMPRSRGKGAGHRLPTRVLRQTPKRVPVAEDFAGPFSDHTRVCLSLTRRHSPSTPVAGRFYQLLQVCWKISRLPRRRSIHVPRVRR